MRRIFALVTVGAATVVILLGGIALSHSSVRDESDHIATVPWPYPTKAQAAKWGMGADRPVTQPVPPLGYEIRIEHTASELFAFTQQMECGGDCKMSDPLIVVRIGRKEVYRLSVEDALRMMQAQEAQAAP